MTKRHGDNHVLFFYKFLIIKKKETLNNLIISPWIKKLIKN